MPRQSNEEDLKNGGSSRSARTVLIMVIALGLSASGALFFTLRAWDQARFQITFEQVGLQVVAVVKGGIDRRLEGLEALKSFYQASEKITRTAFGRFAGNFLKRESGVQAIEWVPRISASERQAYEQAARQDGFPDFKFMEREGSGKLVVAIQRPEYYPVYYVEPYKGNEGALGFDAASDAARLHVLSRCRDTGAYTATPPLRLVQEKTSQQGFVIFVPVYERDTIADTVESRRQYISGFYVMVFRAQDMLNHILKGYAFSGIDLRVYDESPTQTKILLFHKSFPDGESDTGDPPDSEIAAEPRIIEALHIGGRTWSIVIAPTPTLLAERRTWTPWAALAIGILFTAVLTSYVIQAQKRAETAKRLLRETAEREIAEKALRQSEEKFRLFMDNSPAIAWMKDETGRHVYLSRTYEKRFGVRLVDCLGKTDHELWPENVAKTFWESDQRVLVSGHPIAIIEETIDKAGNISFWLNNKFLSEDGSGVRYVAGVGIDITERKRIEAERQEREARFRACFELPIVGFAITSPEKGWIEVNDKLCDIMGYSREELTCMTWPQMTHSEDLPRDSFNFSRVVSGEIEGYSMEKRFLPGPRRAEGGVVWTDLSVSCVRKPDGTVDYFVAFVEDITGRKKTEEALKFTQFVVDNMADSVFWARPNGSFVYVNDAACADLGYSRTELLGMRVWELSPNSSEDQWQSYWLALKANGANVSETWHKKKTGEVFPIEIRVDYLDFNGEEFACGLVRDITDRKRVEQVLRESEERFRLLFKMAPVPLCFMNKEGVLTHFNDRFVQVFGYTSEDIPTLAAWRKRAYPDESYRSWVVETWKAAMKRATEENVDIEPVEYRVTCKDGTVRLVEISGITIEDNFLAILVDVTDRRRLEELAIQAGRLTAVADLSSGVAHHFNNLLQIVMGSTSLSLADLETGDLSEIKVNLEKMLQAATLGAETVKRLQTFANVRSHVTEREGAIFDVACSARNAAEVSKPIWKSDPEKESVKIELRLDLEDGCLVKGQENEMFEVFVNLVRNAAEAMPQGGQIDVKSYKEADEAVITVRDTGIGIAEEDLSKVFQPFWSSKGVGIGKGMGLAVTHGLVKRHGGSISVDSEVGVGTTFTIRLPLAEELFTKPDQSSMRTSRDRLTLLIIDDDLNIAVLLERICAKAGHRVFKALSGQEGLEIFKKEFVDLVISDLGMPGMSGWDVGKAIRSICQERGVRKPPFILLTGWGGQELEKVKITESGTDAVMSKPIDSATVLATVQEIAARFH